MSERKIIVFPLTYDQVLEAVKHCFVGDICDGASVEAMDVDVVTGTLRVAVQSSSFPAVEPYCEAPGQGLTPQSWQAYRQRMQQLEAARSAK